MRNRRWVVDTNIWISHLLLPNSIPHQAFQKALSEGEILVSNETLEELSKVLWRPKFDRYLTEDDRRQFFELAASMVIEISILRPIVACRDPKDDKFLSVAVHGDADGIITGDQDLLDLHPFRGIPIYSPKEFLQIGQ